MNYVCLDRSTKLTTNTVETYASIIKIACILVMSFVDWISFDAAMNTAYSVSEMFE